MREVRPTIGVLKRLPRESFADPSVWDQIQNKDYSNLRLYGLDQPLLVDARRRLGSGTADRHKESTKAAGRPVYEVRDHTGAGWRGAVVLDEHGDPWLVHVHRHDEFHSTARSAFKSGNYLPVGAEYIIRDREEAEAAFTKWRSSLLREIAQAAVRAMKATREISCAVAGHRSPDEAEFEVSIEHDAPASSPAQAHRSQSLITLVLKVRTRSSEEFRQEVLNAVLPFLQPDPGLCEPLYGRDGGSMTVLIAVTQAKMIQLSASVADPRPLLPEDALLPTHLHYTGIKYLTDAYIDGSPVRGVCGTWFVPTRNESAGLPICRRCDEELPIAEEVLRLMGGQAD